jgi:hypothetical protein
MQEAVTIADLALRIIVGVVGLALLIFGAGKAWATVSGMVGSLAAVHRRLTEDKLERQLRDKYVDEQLMKVLLAIERLQAWKQTLRFKMPEAHQEVPLFKEDGP